MTDAHVLLFLTIIIFIIIIIEHLVANPCLIGKDYLSFKVYIIHNKTIDKCSKMKSAKNPILLETHLSGYIPCKPKVVLAREKRKKIFLCRLIYLACI